MEQQHGGREHREYFINKCSDQADNNSTGAIGPNQEDKMMREHTKGPWSVGTMTETGLPGIMADDGPIVAKITKWTSVATSDPEVIQANARLIATAPDLLKDLRNLVRDIEWHGHGSEMNKHLAKCVRTIAVAEGDLETTPIKE